MKRRFPGSSTSTSRRLDRPCKPRASSPGGRAEPGLRRSPEPRSRSPDGALGSTPAGRRRATPDRARPAGDVRCDLGQDLNVRPLAGVRCRRQCRQPADRPAAGAGVRPADHGDDAERREGAGVSPCSVGSVGSVRGQADRARRLGARRRRAVFARGGVRRRPATTYPCPAPAARRPRTCSQEKFPPQQNGANPIVFDVATGKLTDQANKQAINESVKAIKQRPTSTASPTRSAARADGRPAVEGQADRVRAGAAGRRLRRPHRPSSPRTSWTRPHPATKAGITVAAAGSIGDDAVDAGRPRSARSSASSPR